MKGVLIWLLGVAVVLCSSRLALAQDRNGKDGDADSRWTQEGRCSEAQLEVLVFDWFTQDTDLENTTFVQNTERLLQRNDLCLVPMERLLEGHPASIEDLAQAQEIVDEIEGLLAQEIDPRHERWLEAVRLLKQFSTRAMELSFASDPMLESRLFSVYVLVGTIGGENTDENLKTLYMADIIGIQDNANHFMYHAAMLDLDARSRSYAANLGSSRTKKVLGYYQQRIKDARIQKRSELLRVFYRETEWRFPENVDVNTEQAADFLRYAEVLSQKKQDRITIAIPKHGDPNLVAVWRSTENPSSLQRVTITERVMPYVMGTIGVGLSGGATSVATEDGLIATDHFYVFPEGRGQEIESIGRFSLATVAKARVQYRRLGLQLGISLRHKLTGKWVEYVPVSNNDSEDIVTVQMQNNCFSRRDEAEGQRDGEVNGLNCEVLNEYYLERRFAQHRQMGLSYVFGEQEMAYRGLGLRIGAQAGLLDLPNAWTTTLQLGYAHPTASIAVKDATVVVDADLTMGTMILRPRSLMFDLNQMDRITPLFGLVLSSGVVF